MRNQISTLIIERPQAIRHLLEQVLFSRVIHNLLLISLFLRPSTSKLSMRSESGLTRVKLLLSKLMSDVMSRMLVMQTNISINWATIVSTRLNSHKHSTARIIHQVQTFAISKPEVSQVISFQFHRSTYMRSDVLAYHSRGQSLPF